MINSEQEPIYVPVKLDIVKHKDIFDYKSSCFENEKHQTRVLLLLELVSDVYLTANRANCGLVWSSGDVSCLEDHR